jgi:uncharacterized protein (DUF362 family)
LKWIVSIQGISMSKLSRQEFLHLLAVGAGALAVEPLLAACTGKPSVPTSPAATLPAASASPTALPSAALNTQASTSEEIAQGSTASPAAQATEQPTAQPSGVPHLAVARGGAPDELVRRALAVMGGLEKYVPQGASVIIKPNICVAYHSYEYAATTNPWVVGALVKACLDAGARRVQVVDFPFGGSAQEAYSISGIQEQVEAAGGEMAYMSGLKFVDAGIPQGKDLKSTRIYGDVLNADVLIDVPIAKHHSLARLTLGMKNLMGLIQDRGSIHANLGQRIADLTSLFRPTLTVVDAVRILMNNGPTGGDLGDVKQLDTVIISPDIVAADSYAASLFGLRPDDIAYIPAAAAMGLGRSDLENLKVEEITV